MALILASFTLASIGCAVDSTPSLECPCSEGYSCVAQRCVANSMVPDAQVSLADSGADSAPRDAQPSDAQPSDAQPSDGFADDAAIPLANHEGWRYVFARGARVDSMDEVRATASLSLAWFPMSGPGPVESYRVYRRTDEEAEPGKLLGTTSSASFGTDDLGVAGTWYLYTVQPIINGVEHRTDAAYSSLRVVSPPDNMVFIHRMMANHVVCDRMRREVDIESDHSCAYTGPTSVNGRFRMPYDLLVDTVELGCNYGRGTECDGQACIGARDPNGTVEAAQGTVYYDRAGVQCFISNGGTSWSRSDDAGARVGTMASSAPRLPPLSFVSQMGMQEACSGQQELVDGLPRSKRLLSRREQLVAAAWDPSLGTTVSVAVEQGNEFPASGSCNTTQGAGLMYDDLDIPADLETLPNTTNLPDRQMVITGSNATRNCVSWFGVQDLVGNQWEWVSDQLDQCSGTTCTGAVSNVVPENHDFDGFVVDELSHSSGTIHNFWPFAEASFVNVPLGLPTTSAATTDAIVIGSGAGELTPESFNDDQVHIWVSLGDYRRGVMGGGRSDEPDAGPWSVNLNRAANTIERYLGGRCAIELR